MTPTARGPLTAGTLPRPCRQCHLPWVCTRRGPPGVRFQQTQCAAGAPEPWRGRERAEDSTVSTIHPVTSPAFVRFLHLDMSSRRPAGDDMSGAAGGPGKGTGGAPPGAAPCCPCIPPSAAGMIAVVSGDSFKCNRLEYRLRPKSPGSPLKSQSGAGLNVYATLFKEGPNETIAKSWSRRLGGPAVQTRPRRGPTCRAASRCQAWFPPRRDSPPSSR